MFSYHSYNETDFSRPYKISFDDDTKECNILFEDMICHSTLHTHSYKKEKDIRVTQVNYYGFFNKDNSVMDLI